MKRNPPLIQPSPSTLLTYEDVAAILQVAPATVRSWKADRRLRAVSAGRAVRFDRDYIYTRLEAAKRGGDFLEPPEHLRGAA